MSYYMTKLSFLLPDHLIFPFCFVFIFTDKSSWTLEITLRQMNLGKGWKEKKGIAWSTFSVKTVGRVGKFSHLNALSLLFCRKFWHIVSLILKSFISIFKRNESYRSNIGQYFLNRGSLKVYGTKIFWVMRWSFNDCPMLIWNKANLSSKKHFIE